MDERTADLEKATHRFGEAWAIGDVAVLDSLLSPTYTHADAFGKSFDRSAWLAYARSRSDRATNIRFQDVRIRIIGDVGIVTGANNLLGAGIRNAADRTELTIRFTQVWIWQQGRWLREAFQATPVQS